MKQNFDIAQTVANIEMMNDGIVPLDMNTVNKDINVMMRNVSGEEARQMRRKFRKLWRKISTTMVNDGVQDFGGFGKKGCNPSQIQKRNRKLLVKGFYAEAARAALKTTNPVNDT